MTEQEIRMRCLEAAARAPTVHQDGFAAGVLAVAAAWEEYVVEGRKVQSPAEVSSLL